jgi:hypothetical protein
VKLTLDNCNIKNDLAAYGVALDVAREESNKTNQKGTKVFGITDTGPEYEVTTGDAFELAEYNVGFNIIADDSQGFSLIVRKENEQSLANVPTNKLRKMLRHIVDAA